MGTRRLWHMELGSWATRNGRTHLMPTLAVPPGLSLLRCLLS